MDDWPAHENLTQAGSAVNDQQTENSVLVSMRVGHNVQPYNLDSYMYDEAYLRKVRSFT